MRTSRPTSAPALYVLQIHGAPAFQFCVENGFLGVGCAAWPAPRDWESYERAVVAAGGAVHSAARAIYEIPDGALIWTRDPGDGVIYLAKVTGPWRYLDSAAADDCDIHNVRPVQTVACLSSACVPSTIASRFIGEWTIQHIHDDVTARRSAATFAELAEDPEATAPTLDDVLTQLLDDQDLEGLVCVYLQHRRGYYVRPGPFAPGPSARRRVLRDATARRAVVRARRGHHEVARDAGSLPIESFDQVLVFSPTDTYGPDPAPNVIVIDYEEIVEFMHEERWRLPDAVDHWVARALGQKVSRPAV